ncbi:MAG: DUF3459 domain-containing protein, partial [Bryobacteraceae bacterium]
LLTEANRGYLGDFGKYSDLKKAITEGFVYDGNRSPHRRRRHGSSSKGESGHKFVSFIQNHDQIANTSQGERLSALVSVETQKLGAAILLSAPYLPMLFMGQEFGETAPFLYFTSHSDPALAEAVSNGRRREFEEFFHLREFSDPQSPETFQESKINWTLLERSPNREILTLYRDWISLRKALPCLYNGRKDLTAVHFDESSRWLILERDDPSNQRALLICNFSGNDQEVPIENRTDDWTRAIWTADPRYAGSPRCTPPERLEIGVEELNVPVPASSAVLYTSVR